MTAGLADVLEAVRASISVSTGSEVGLGEPPESRSALLLLPYRIRQESLHRNSPPASPGDPSASAPWNVTADSLLLANPPHGYEALGKALNRFAEEPVIALGATRITVTVSVLPVEDLAAICRSAGVKLTLAAPLELSWTPGH